MRMSRDVPPGLGKFRGGLYVLPRIDKVAKAREKFPGWPDRLGIGIKENARPRYQTAEPGPLAGRACWGQTLTGVRWRRNTGDVVEEGDVGGEESVGLIVIVEIHGGKLVFRGVQDVGVPRRLG